MACAGCERRREWLKKWMKIAYERATGKPIDRSADSGDGSQAGADRGNKPAG